MDEHSLLSDTTTDLGVPVHYQNSYIMSQQVMLSSSVNNNNNNNDNNSDHQSVMRNPYNICMDSSIMSSTSPSSPSMHTAGSCITSGVNQFDNSLPPLLENNGYDISFSMANFGYLPEQVELIGIRDAHGRCGNYNDQFQVFHDHDEFVTPAGMCDNDTMAATTTFTTTSDHDMLFPVIHRTIMPKNSNQIVINDSDSWGDMVKVDQNGGIAANYGNNSNGKEGNLKMGEWDSLESLLGDVSFPFLDFQA